LPGARRKHVPLRMCVVCGQKRPKRELIRIVRMPDGSITIDPKGKQPGRGAYVCRQEECWQERLDTRALARGFKARVVADEVSALQDLIAERLTEERTFSQQAETGLRRAEAASTPPAVGHERRKRREGSGRDG